MRLLTSAVVVACMFVTGCGKSEEQRQAEQAAAELKKAAESVAKAAESAGAAAAGQATTDVAAAMKTMASALSGTGPDGKPVEPVAFQALQTTLPTVSGWERGDPQGQRMNMPFPFSESEAEYRKGDARIEVKVVDTGFAQMLIAPWSMMLAAGYSRESSDGYEKATTVSGHPAVEKWDQSSKRGELNVLVGKRFMVSLDGRRLDDTKALHEFASQMDFGKLAAMK